MRGAGYNILNGAGCNRNSIHFNMSEVFVPALRVCLLELGPKSNEAIPNEAFIITILIKKSGFRNNIYHKNYKPDSHILVCYVRYSYLNM